MQEGETVSNAAKISSSNGGKSKQPLSLTDLLAKKSSSGNAVSTADPLSPQFTTSRIEEFTDNLPVDDHARRHVHFPDEAAPTVSVDLEHLQHTAENKLEDETLSSQFHAEASTIDVGVTGASEFGEANYSPPSAARSELEPEMPSSSQSVFVADTELPQLFGFSSLNEDSATNVSRNSTSSDQGYAKLYDRLALFEQDKRHLLQELSNAKQALAAAEADQQQALRECKQRAEQQINKLKSEFQSVHESHIKEIEQLRGASHDAQHLHELKADFEMLLVEKHKLEQQLERERDEGKLVRTDFGTTRGDLNAARLEIGKVKSELELSVRENNELRAELARLQHTVEAVQHESHQERKAMEEQMVTLRKELSERTNIQNRMQNDIQTFERNNQMLVHENNMLQQRVAHGENCERELQQMRWRADSLEQQMQQQYQQMRQQMQQQQQQIQQHYASYAQAPIPTLQLPVLSPTFPPAPPPTPAVISHIPPAPPAASTTPSSGSSVNSSVYSSSANDAIASGGLPSRKGMDGGNQAAGTSGSTSKSLADLMGKRSKASPTSGASESSINGFGSAANLTNDPSAMHRVRKPSPKQDQGSLASLLNARKSPVAGGAVNSGSAPYGTVERSPFANDVTSAQMSSQFQLLDAQLTSLMTEKTSLREEGERLHQRGLKTLKDRTRLQQVEFRLEELDREISNLRRELSMKPA